MPGLAGVLTHGRPLHGPHEILKTIRDVHLVSGVTYIQRTFHAERVAISNILTGLLKSTLNQPATTPSANIVLFLEGEIFNYKELAERIGDFPGSSPCELLLGLFDKLGDDFIRHVSGEFNIVIYEKTDMRLSIYSDHIGSMPMYYIESDDQFLFGSEKKSILALLNAPPRVDPVGLLQVFAHRHNLDDRTFLEGMKRMMPGTRLVRDRGHTKHGRYHNFSFRVPQSIPRVEELVEQWSRHLEIATARRLEGKKRILVSLSAGLDSRAVACAIPRNFRPISSNTRGSAHALEPMLSSKIAGRLGFDHFREDPSVSSYSSVIPKIAWRTECEIHFTNGISLSNHKMTKELGDFIVGGWLGDASSGAHISPHFLRPCTRAEFIEKTYSRYLVYHPGALGNIFTREFLIETFPVLREAFIESFSDLSADTNIQLFELWDLYQRQRRMTTGSMPVDSYAFEKVRPFYDKDYLDFTFTLPTRYRFGQSLYQAMIYRLGPEIRDIPSANSGLRVHQSIIRNALNKSLTVSRRAMIKLNEKVRPRHPKYIQHGLNEDLAVGTRLDLGFRNMIEEFTRSSDFDSSIFNRSGIFGMLDQHYAKRADRSFELGYVATFASGWRYFLSKTVRCPSEAEPLL